jgi:hypothetical protein
MRRREFLSATAAVLVLPASRLASDAVAVAAAADADGAPPTAAAAAAERHLLYIAEPGIRNYVSYGGVGVLVYDIGQGYRFVKRIPTWNVPAGQEPEN